jgi:hypothetical protein
MCSLVHFSTSSSFLFTLPHQFIKKLKLTGSTSYEYSDLWSSVRAFGLGSASCRGTKRPQTQSNDLHSRLSSTFPEVPSRLAERQLASPILTSPSKFDLLKCGPRNGAAFLFGKPYRGNGFGSPHRLDSCPRDKSAKQEGFVSGHAFRRAASADASLRLSALSLEGTLNTIRYKILHTKCARNANSSSMKTPPTQIRKFTVILKN